MKQVRAEDRRRAKQFYSKSEKANSERVFTVIPMLYVGSLNVISDSSLKVHRLISKPFAILSFFMVSRQKWYMVFNITVKVCGFAKGIATSFFAILQHGEHTAAVVRHREFAKLKKTKRISVLSPLDISY
jgi:hypothetical protein